MTCTETVLAQPLLVFLLFFKSEEHFTAVFNYVNLVLTVFYSNRAGRGSKLGSKSSVLPVLLSRQLQRIYLTECQVCANHRRLCRRAHSILYNGA